MIQHRTTHRIAIATEGGPHAWAIINAIADRLGPVTVILEAPEPKFHLIGRRMRNQGLLSAAGQTVTMVVIRIAKRFLAARAARIVAENGLSTAAREGQHILEVPDINAPEFLKAIRGLDPGIVFLLGCRMLRPATLQAIHCPILNYHAGIAPKYRGMNGGYWALATGDRENFGATIHLVDNGVDTGPVLFQVRGTPGPGDNLMLYPLRLVAMSREICIRAIEQALAGNLHPVDPALPSQQWYHPPIWTYVWTGLRRGVW